jgi:hypothetical protein
LEIPVIRKLLDNGDLQSLLKDERYQILFHDVLRMNKGRAEAEPEDTLEAVPVLASVTDSPDGSFF